MTVKINGKMNAPTSPGGAFAQAIAARPYDPGPRSMYIDWLQEGGWFGAAAVQRAALEQRLKFGPLTPQQCADHWQHLSHWNRIDVRIDVFVSSIRYLRRDLDRQRRYRRLCRHHTRLGPSGLWEWQVTGPDPQVFPLDCPPDDERRRYTRWRAYPDEWLALWVPVCGPGGLWKPVLRFFDGSDRRLAAYTADGDPWIMRNQDGLVVRHAPGVRPPENDARE